MTLSPTPKSKVLVLGSGNFGSCLADHLGDSEHEVSLWSRHASFVEYFNAHRRNPTYLKDHTFPANIRAVGPGIPDREMIQQMDVLLFAIPTQGLRWVLHVLPLHLLITTRIVDREFLTKLRASLVGEYLPLMIFVNKGIETDTQALTLEIIADTCGSDIARAATFIVRQHADVWSHMQTLTLRSRALLLLRKVGSMMLSHFGSADRLAQLFADSRLPSLLPR